MTHLFENTATVDSEDREGKTKRRFFCRAPGNESVWLHLLAFLSTLHPASRFLTLLCKLLLSVSLEFCSWCALARISLFKSPIISPALYRLPLPQDPHTQVQLCVCDGEKHEALPCHDQHSSVPFNDTWRHPTVHITMVAKLSAWLNQR